MNRSIIFSDGMMGLVMTAVMVAMTIVLVTVCWS